jgi:hypothetical protein
MGFQSQRRVDIFTQNRYDGDMSGQGLLDSIKNIFKSAKRGAERVFDSDLGVAARNLIPGSDENARSGFSGERHALLKLPNGKFGQANYMGPGTNLIARLKRGDPGRTVSDEVSKAHDIRYGLAKTSGDIRQADQAMLRALANSERDGTDNRLNIKQGELIKLKNIGEDIGLIKKDAFSGDLSKNALAPPDDLALMKSNLSQLQQKGYGKKKSLPTDRLMKKIGKTLGSGYHGSGVQVKTVPKISVRNLMVHLGLDKKISFEKVKQQLGANPTHEKVLNVLLKASGLKKISKTTHAKLLKNFKGEMGGSGLFSSFLSGFRKVAKIAAPIAAVVAPEFAIPIGIGSAFL